MNAKKRASELRKLLNYHSDRYYNQDSPEISDGDYDKLMGALRELEEAHPELIVKRSPTQRVGGTAKRSAGVLIAHRVPMLSMQDLFSKEAVDHFVDDCREKLGEEISFLVETKIDGLSLALRYEAGTLQSALTRGDGRSFGEDVTANAKVIADIPLELSEGPDYLEVRGEVYMTNEAFAGVNERQALLGKKVFANPRNCAAGTLRQLDSGVTQARGLSFFAFNIQDIQGASLETHAQAYDYLRQRGLTVMEHYTVCQSAQEVWEAIQGIETLRDSLPYEIDGAVVKVNELALRGRLRDTSKNAGYLVAYKYPPEQKETKLIDIELSVGRTGKIIPTAILEPIRLSGSTVSRATLHNQDFINKYEICIGSTLLIEKSGDVIPKCVGEVKEKRPEGASPFVFPTFCPVCGSPASREEDTADIYCMNMSCPAQLERLITHFVGRDAMDLKGFGEAYVQVLLEEGYLQDVADIFTLAEHREALIEAGLIGKEKNTDKLLAVIEKAKGNPPHKLLTGLGIPNVGKSAAKELMNAFGSLDALAEATEEALVAVPDVGETTARCVLDYFADETHQQLLEKLRQAGVKLAQEQDGQAQGGQPLAGLTFVITGTFSEASREEIAQRIEEHGGKVRGSVSPKTSYLLAGEEAGSKLAKAQSLNVPVMDWAGLIALLKPQTEDAPRRDG